MTQRVLGSIVSLLGHCLHTQQVDSGDRKNTEVVTDES